MSARKILTPEQKVGILREHLIEKVPVSQVCDKHGVSIVNFYNWQGLQIDVLQSSLPESPVPGQAEDRDLHCQSGRKCF